MTYETKLVENIDGELWNKFVGLAKIKNMKVGELLNEVVFITLEKANISTEKELDEDGLQL